VGCGGSAVRTGVFERVAQALQRAGDAAGLLGWERHYVDASIVRAHQHAVGAKRGLTQMGSGATAVA
jgi:hypothetical protein